VVEGQCIRKVERMNRRRAGKKRVSAKGAQQKKEDVLFTKIRKGEKGKELKTCTKGPGFAKWTLGELPRTAKKKAKRVDLIG